MFGFEDVVDSEDGKRDLSFEGVTNFLARHYEDSDSPAVRRWAESFMNKKPCPECLGSRLKKEAMYFRINQKNIFVWNWCRGNYC